MKLPVHNNCLRLTLLQILNLTIMNEQMLSSKEGFKLLEKKYLPSRIACLALFILLLAYLIPSNDLLGPSILSGGLAVLFVVQFFQQNRIMNYVLGGIMFLVGLYFCAAVIDEFMEFETVTRSAKQLLIFGLGGFGTVMLLAVLMIRRAILD